MQTSASEEHPPCPKMSALDKSLSTLTAESFMHSLSFHFSGSFITNVGTVLEFNNSDKDHVNVFLFLFFISP